jgi:hypothetical protein
VPNKRRLFLFRLSEKNVQHQTHRPEHSPPIRVRCRANAEVPYRKVKGIPLHFGDDEIGEVVAGLDQIAPEND